MRRFLQDALRADASDGARDARYAVAFVDLDGDRRDEALVYVMGSHICGSGGCHLFILARRGSGWRVVTDTSVTHRPIRILSTRTRGWRDIGVFVRGGGILPGYEARLRFNGRSYPDNPSDVPASRRRAAGRIVISEQDRGRPVFP